MSRGSSSKSQLFLMEFICVIMFFALCAGLCVSAFVKADAISKEGKRLNEALLMAQSIAENIKALNNTTEDTITNIVNEIGEDSANKYKIVVKNDWNRNMLTSNILIYNAEDSKSEEICSIVSKKYLPGGVDDEK